MKNLIIVLFFLIAFSTIQTKALCVTDSIKTKQLKGIAADSNGNPFPNVKIELKNINDYEFVIKSVVTDEQGKFDLGEIKSGNI